MNIPIEFFIFVSGILGSLIGSGIVALYYRRRHTGLYNRGWSAGREFALRNLHDTITR